MSTPSGPAAASAPVERFKPTSGTLVGYAGLALAVVVLAYVVLDARNLDGVRIAVGTLLFGMVVWLTQLRPRATAYRDHVVLKGIVRDSHVPLAAVDEIALGQTLNLWVGDERYVCIGIGSSFREEIKASRKREQTLGTSRMTEFALRSERANTDERAMSYQTFVVTRLEELVDEARRRHRGEPAPRPRRVWAWPEVAALAVTAAVFVLLLLV